MHGMRRPVLLGYEDGASDDESGECWRLSSLSQPNTPHFCRSCMLGFRDRILLNNHLKQHYMENRAATSQSQPETETITKTSSQDPMFRCLNCRETFLSPNQLKIHCESCQPEDAAWQCDVCEELFEDKVQLNAHFISTHGEQNIARRALGVECPHCGLVFDNQQEMKVHIQIDHEMQVAVNKGRGNKQREMYITVACQCGKVFVNELDYQEHILEQHPGSEPLKWPTDMADLKKRKRSEGSVARRNMSEYQAKRSRKPARYSANSRMNNRTTNHHHYDGSDEGGVCVECGETFAQTVELKRHMQSDHIHLKPYACSICGRRFTRKSDVKRHIETIHGQAVSKEDMERIQAIRPFRCAKCGNPFGRYSDIKKHIEVHHGLPFSPDTYVYQLEHMEEAGLSIGSSGEVVNVRTYDCGLCKRKYRNKTTVRHHIRKDHNQEDPDAFITRSHHFSHSEQECQFCGDVFNCIEDKIEHVQNIHQTMVEEDSMVDTPLHSTVLQHDQEMVHEEGEDCENFMPVKDVSTPEKLRYNSKNQIVILKQELVNKNHDKDTPPPELRMEKKEGGTWSNTLINDIVTEQQRGKSSYDCPECSRVFTRPKALQNHILKMHSKRSDDFECDLCGRTYKEQKQFVKHLEVAHPEIRGDKQASNNTDNLKKDKNTGDIEGLFFNCASCGKSFQDEADLKAHISTAHSQNSRAGQRAALRHSALKEATPQQVVSTQSVSVDDMPMMEYYTCNVCGAMFSSTESLTRHMNLKHKDISIIGRRTVIGGLHSEEDRQEEEDEDEDEDEEDKGEKEGTVQNVSVEYT